MMEKPATAASNPKKICRPREMDEVRKISKKLCPFHRYTSMMEETGRRARNRLKPRSNLRE